MLPFELIFSAALLLFINLSVWFNWRGGSAATWALFVVMVALPFALIFNMAVLFQAFLIGISLVYWSSRRRSTTWFLKRSIASTLIGYGLALGVCALDPQHLQGLRKLYPYESISARLDGRRPIPSPVVDVKDVSETLAYQVDLRSFDPTLYRREILRRLHEEKVELFLNSSGFGIMRGSAFPSGFNLKVYARDDLIPAQPAAGPMLNLSADDVIPVSDDDRRPLRKLLVDSTVNFVNSEGFGYFKDREHVAGFFPHQFRRLPEPTKHWEVNRLELVSLLLHESPVVYVSDQLPAMSDFKKHPTRPLDRFESEALEEIKAGKDLEARQDHRSIRMLGAIRASKSCLDCHDAHAEDLLGAFSYQLRLSSPDNLK